MPLLRSMRRSLRRNVVLSLCAVFFLLTGRVTMIFSLGLSPLVANAATTGLVAAYSFNEGSGTTVSDASGNSNTGTTSNTTWTAQGKFGKALAFNGTNARVTVKDSNSLHLTTGMTLEAWVYPTVTPSGWRTVVDKSVDIYYLMAGSSQNTPAVGGTFTAGNQNTYAPSPLPVNIWTHLAATYDGAMVRLYVNGLEVASQPQTTPLTSSTKALYIGGNSPYGEYFKGRLDEVRIYNRALTQGEIQSDMNTPIGAASSDTTPPSAPSNLTATAISTSQITLAWTASTDNIGVTGYRVERCQGTGCSSFTQVATPTGTTYTDTGLLTATSYSYRVWATDAAGNPSPYSNIASATTLAPDTTPPSAPSNLTATAISTSQITLAWTASTDNIGVTGYRVERCQGTGCSSFTQVATATGATYSDTGLLPATSYSYRVRAVDAAGNLSPYSNTVSATTNSQPNPQASGLVAAYSFKEGSGTTVADSSGNANTGTINGATWSTQGKFGNALVFNGTNARVTVNDSPSLHLTTGMTLEAWVYPTTVAGGWTDVIYKLNDMYYLEGSSLQGGVPATGGTFSPSPLYGTATLPVNAWSHLAGTYDGATMRLYVNGLEVANQAWTGLIQTSTQPLTIGGDAFYGQYWVGRIDEVRIYDRALAPSEIQNDMNTSIGGEVLVAAQIGEWSGPFDWPLAPIHMTLLPTGEILAWEDETNNQAAQVWNPTTNTFTSVLYNAADLFCSGHAALPDGRILVDGGHVAAYVGIPNTTIFDPATHSWAAAAPMSFARWYPTVTSLPDGSILAVSGAINCPTCSTPTGSHAGIADIPEVYNPTTNTWRQLTNARLSLPLYPHMFVLPDGRVLASSTQEDRIATVVLDLNAQTWSIVDPVAVDGGSAAMYAPGKIIKSGTARNPDYPTAASVASTYVLDMSQPSPVWRQTAPMAFARTQHDLTLLPDGTVLVTGGSGNSNVFDLSAAVFAAELWSPTTETWTTMANMQVPRLYHSIALLLPDARVLVAGGGEGFGVAQLSAEIYLPPYLFKGPRPSITSAPNVIQYGQTFFVQTPDSSRIAKVSLVRPGSVTHAFDANQRFLALTFQQASGGLNVQAPGNANLAPPGYYLLFIVDTNGVPSVASFVKFPLPG